MPRPMIPAPMTAMVRTSAMPLCSLLELVDDSDEVGVGLAHVFAEAFFFVVREQMQSGSDAAERGCDVVYVIHHANEFTAGRHKVPFSASKRSNGYSRWG